MNYKYYAFNLVPGRIAMFGHDMRTLGQLFSTPNSQTEASFFQVPKYQRKYTWEKENQVTKLLDDVFDNIDQSEKEKQVIKPYYMGPIIVCPLDANDSIELIDGQQRLVTLAIFIRGLVDYLEIRINAGSFPQRRTEHMGMIRYELKSKIVKGWTSQPTPVIHLGRKIDRPFRETILMPDTPDRADLLKTSKKGEHPSTILLFDAYTKVWDELRERYDAKTGDTLADDLNKLQSLLLNQIWFLVITVKDKFDANTVFETMNARGKQLNLSDLVKNAFFEKFEDRIEATNIDDFENEWDDAEVAVSDFASFMWHAWFSRYPTWPKNKVFDVLQKEIQVLSPADVFEFAADLIFDESRFYHSYENPSSESKEDKRHCLETLAAMDATRCYPLLLSIDWANRKRHITDSEAIKILKQITRLTFWYSGICGKDAKRLESTYHSLAHSLRQKDKTTISAFLADIDRTLQKELPTVDECKASFKTGAFNDSKFIKMVLCNIENTEFNHVELELRSPAKVQLEHVLPRTPMPSWLNVFPNDRERTEYTYRFGNFTLLDKRLNVSVTNAPFAKKKQGYKKSHIELTKSLCAIPEWNKTEIDNRTDRLFELSRKIWPIKDERGT
ncbi:MAG: DUF262 domain-containing protein [Dehalococcoidia bacterium]|nr:DUF262 domain-containing protein [Dehalococcoidia bacterium]